MSQMKLTGRYCFTTEHAKVGLLGRIFGARGQEMLMLRVEETGVQTSFAGGSVDAHTVTGFRPATCADLNDPALAHLVNPPYNRGLRAA